MSQEEKRGKEKRQEEEKEKRGAKKRADKEEEEEEEEEEDEEEDEEDEEEEDEEEDESGGKSCSHCERKAERKGSEAVSVTGQGGVGVFTVARVMTTQWRGYLNRLVDPRRSQQKAKEIRTWNRLGRVIVLLEKRISKLEKKTDEPKDPNENELEMQQLREETSRSVQEISEAINKIKRRKSSLSDLDSRVRRKAPQVRKDGVLKADGLGRKPTSQGNKYTRSATAGGTEALLAPAQVSISSGAVKTSSAAAAAGVQKPLNRRKYPGVGRPSSQHHQQQRVMTCALSEPTIDSQPLAGPVGDSK